jgi:hypothetical protein
VGHGSLLAGRYRLEERVRTGPDGSLWRAVDETLDRQVSVRVVRPGHRNTADVVDAARRAALVEDSRLVRVLDVGESHGSAYIVAEHLVGRTVEELLADGPLPAELVRRLIGEAAQALDRASARGLHHLRLSPASLVVAPNGSIKVLGTAVEAALAGVEQDEDPLGADREDAVGLVRVLYTGLTGRWPGPVDGPLGPAPRITGRAVPPADLMAGIPNDLDTLCAVTLGPHDDGPQSPGELATQLAPWAKAEPLTQPGGLTVAGPTRPGPAGAARPERSDASTGAGGPQTVPAESSGVFPNPGRAVARGAGSATPTGGAPAARHATPAAGLSAAALEPSMPTLLPREPEGGRAAVGPVGQPRPAPRVAAGTSTAGGNGSDPPARPAASAGVAERERPALRVSPAVASATATVPTSAPAGPNGSGGSAGVRTEPEGRTGGGEPGRNDPGRSGQDADWALLAAPRQPAAADEPIGPFIPPAPLSRPPRDQARLVLTLVAAMVVVGLILAVFSLRGLGSAAPLVGTSTGPLIPSPGASTGKAGAAPPPSSSSPALTGTTPPSAGTAEITGIQAIDPQGDGNENGSAATRAIDGDPGSTWRSDRYETADFGGLKKGLGLYLTISGGPVRSVTVAMPGTGGTVELRTATGPGLDSSNTVVTAEVSAGQAVLTPQQPIPADTALLLWFTSLPRQPTGEFRLVVGEITVT